MPDEYKVQVTGLREFQKALKQLDADLPKKLKVKFLAIATGIAGRVSARVPTGPTGHAAASVKAHGTLKGAQVTAGGARVPYYPWLDFGGAKLHARGVTPNRGGGPMRHPYSKTGRYMFPVIHEALPETQDAAMAALREAAKDAGWGWEEL